MDYLGSSTELQITILQINFKKEYLSKFLYKICARSYNDRALALPFQDIESN